jgi:hypothetical protein
VNTEEECMKVKLTLSIEEAAIERAKIYAKNKKQSLSSLVQNYFNFLSESNSIDEIEISENIKE